MGRPRCTPPLYLQIENVCLVMFSILGMFSIYEWFRYVLYICMMLVCSLYMVSLWSLYTFVGLYLDMFSICMWFRYVLCGFVMCPS
jgi:hypothetical protein